MVVATARVMFVVMSVVMIVLNCSEGKWTCTQECSQYNTSIIISGYNELDVRVCSNANNEQSSVNLSHDLTCVSWRCVYARPPRYKCKDGCKNNCQIILKPRHQD